MSALGSSAGPAAPAGAARLLREARRSLEEAGLRGSFLVRDLGTGTELALDAGRELPLASLVKIPLAVAVLDGVRRGDLDEAEPVDVVPRPGDAASPGLGYFRHPCRVALGDLVYLCLAVSDNVATEALFERVPPAAVTRWLADHGHDQLVVRHTLRDLADTPRLTPSTGGDDLTQLLATTGHTASEGHRVRQLDVARATSGTARAVADLVAAVWSEEGMIHPIVTARVRELLGANLHRQRLWPDFASDASTWSSKTGTVLSMRHEVGVVEHRDGDRFVVAALTASSVAATVQPAAEAVMADVARRMHDLLRGR